MPPLDLKVDKMSRIESVRFNYEPIPCWHTRPSTWCGVRDLSDAQRIRLENTPVNAVVWESTNDTTEKSRFADRLDDALDQKPETPCLVHVDLDCLDISLGHVNKYASAGSLDESDLLQGLEIVSKLRKAMALTVAYLNPLLDESNGTADVAVNTISRLISCMKDSE